MPRRVEDIVPTTKKRSIKNVLVSKDVSSARKRKTEIVSNKLPTKKLEELSEEKEVQVEELFRKTETSHKDENVELKVELESKTTSAHHHRRRKKPPILLIMLGIVAVVAGFGFLASKFYSKETFTIIPKQYKSEFSNTIVAKYKTDTSKVAGSLYYEVVNYNYSASTTVNAVDGGNVSTKAQGKVTLYNNYGTTSQKLIAGTRLSNISGKIYRTTGSIIIPGKDPIGNVGKVIVGVVADQAGQEYNISKNSNEEFRIVGYKGTAKYTSFYGRPYTDISGGYKGTKKTVQPEVLSSTTQSLKDTIITHLKQQAKSLVPKDYISYDSLNIINTSPIKISGNNPKKADISMDGNIQILIFKRDQLINRLSDTKDLQSFGNFKFDTIGLEEAEVSVVNSKDFNPAKKTDLFIKIKSSIVLKGIVPVHEIKAKLLGQPLSKSITIIKEYMPIIQDFEGELVPSWASVPNDPNRLNIIIKESK
jgi:hypothetical protein